MKNKIVYGDFKLTEKERKGQIEKDEKSLLSQSLKEQPNKAWMSLGKGR